MSKPLKFLGVRRLLISKPLKRIYQVLPCMDDLSHQVLPCMDELSYMEVLYLPTSISAAILASDNSW